MKRLLLLINFLGFALAQEVLPPPPPPPSMPAQVDPKEFENYFPSPKEVREYKNYERKLLEELVFKHKVNVSTTALLYYASHSNSVALYPYFAVAFLFSDKIDRVYASFKTKQLDVYENMVVVVPDEGFTSGNLIVVYGKNVVSITVENILNSHIKNRTLYPVVVVKEDKQRLSEEEKVKILDAALKMYGRYLDGEVMFVYNGQRYIIKRVKEPVRNAIAINGKFYEVKPVSREPLWVP